MFERIDAAHTKVIGRDIDAAGNIALQEAETAAQHAAAGDLHHGCVYRRIPQYHLRRNRPRHIAGNAELAVNVNAVS